MSEAPDEIKLLIEELVTANEQIPEIILIMEEPKEEEKLQHTLEEELKITDEMLSKNAERLVNGNNIQSPPTPPSVFSIGQRCNTVPQSKRKRVEKQAQNAKRQKIEKKNRLQKQSKSHTKEQEEEQPKPKEPKVLVEEMLLLFNEHNPYYVNSRIIHKVYNEKKPEILFSFKPINTHHCKIIIPLNNQTVENFFAYQAIRYKSGNFFDWQLILGELDVRGPLFCSPHIKHRSKYLKKTKMILKEDIYKEADSIFYNNQHVRWQLKRLVNKWLIKKSTERIIGEECDIITGDPIPQNEQIKIISIKNRTTYVFSGHVLVKSAKACLEGQMSAIPFIKTPHNPYTNTPFSYGELVKLYAEVLIWCAKKGKQLPGIIGLYREYKFKNHMLLRINNNYVQAKATENFILNDDARGEFFVETMENMLDDFALPLDLEFDSLLIGYQRFKIWNQMEPKHFLVIAWKKLAADYWYYKQTEQLPREHWRTESSIYLDISILLKASHDKLKNVAKEYYRQRAQIIVDV